jgi:hypothetical protein
MRPMSSLRTTLDDLAHRFAEACLAAIRGASIEDLLEAQGAVSRPGPGRRTAPAHGKTIRMPPAAPPARAKFKGGRLLRRSPDEIDKTLGLVVAMLKATPGQGMRSEEIQSFLRLDKRELPVVLQTGLRSKKLRSKGQKRATTYFAA